MWSSLPKVPTEVCIGPSLKGEKASLGVILENEEGAQVRVSWKVCVFVCVCVYFMSGYCMYKCIPDLFFAASGHPMPLNPDLKVGSELEEASFIHFSSCSASLLSLLCSRSFPLFCCPSILSLLSLLPHISFLSYSPFPELSLWEVVQEFAFVFQL